MYKTWIKARNRRRITENHIFHSDRGVQYASNKMKLIFNENKNINQSMSRKGNYWDNALAESFFKTIKYECIYRHKFTSYIHTYNCIDNYIKWYNTKRLHSALGYKTPFEIEIEYYNKIKLKKSLKKFVPNLLGSPVFLVLIIATSLNDLAVYMTLI